LYYEKQEGGAPRVVASGRGAIGDKIVETARAHGVPVENNPGLAVALADVEIGEEIPLELYKAVAEVLIFIMRMSGRLR
jgi:flagellar biosynthesis protein